MGLRWFARAVDTAALAQAWREPERRADLLDEETEDPSLHLDKAWDGLWYLLSPARRRWLGQQKALISRERERLLAMYPGFQGMIAIEAEAPGMWRVDAEGAAIAGVRSLAPAADGCFFRALGRQRVVEIAKLLAGLQKRSLAAHLDAKEMDRLGVYPGGWQDDGEARDWLLSSFAHLGSFYTDSARLGRAVVLRVS